jgi:tetratricopeptide (TPR) repeat protein
VLAEARQCFDRAKKLAPTNENQWENRIGFLMAEFEWFNAFQMARGKPPLPAEVPTPELQAMGFKGGTALTALPDLQAECCEAAQRCPDHIGMQAFGVTYVLPKVKQRATNRALQKDKSPLMTVQEAQFLEDTIARIKKIAQKASGETAVYCDRMQTVFLMQLATMDQQFTAGLGRVEPILRRIVEAAPKDSDAALFLEAIVVDQGNFEAGLEIAKNRLTNDPCVRNRYALARAFDYCGKTELAAKELDDCLALDPEEAHCLAGRAVLWLREGDETNLHKAGRYLDKARLAIKPSASSATVEDIEFLQAIYRVLSGQTVIGRLGIESLRTENPHNPRYREALQCMEP